MGIIKKAVKGIVEGAIEGRALDIAANVANGAVEVLEKSAKGVSKATAFVQDKALESIENRNLKKLKKEAKKQDYCLFVEKENKLSEGVYKIVDKKKQDRYNTLMEQPNSRSFTIRLYSSLKGEVASVSKNDTLKGFLSSKEEYEFNCDSLGSGIIKESREGNNKVYSISMNDWIATGDFEKGNYKLFCKQNGKTVATINKKYSSASSFSIECEHDKYEPLVVLFTILIDIVN